MPDKMDSERCSHCENRGLPKVLSRVNFFGFGWIQDDKCPKCGALDRKVHLLYACGTGGAFADSASVVCRGGETWSGDASSGTVLSIVRF